MLLLKRFYIAMVTGRICQKCQVKCLATARLKKNATHII